jgi:heptose-I-phosphate ethanolaminephosphotransferase
MKVHPYIKSLKAKFPTELQTLKVYLTVLAVLLLMLAAEFVTLYAAGVNTTIGNPFLQALPLYLALSAPVLFLGKWGNRVYLPVLILPVFLITACGSLVSSSFHMQIDGDIILVVLSSSLQETQEFINTFYGVKPILILLSLAALTGYLLYWLFRQPMKRTCYTVILGVLLLLPYSISCTRYIVMGKAKRCFDRVLCTRIISEYFIFKKEFGVLKDIAENPELPAGIRLKSPDAANILGVIVIGESANRNHMGIYGYSRTTDPEIRKAVPPVLPFDDVISAYASTTWAIRYLFTMSEIGPARQDSKCSLVDILKAGGYRIDMVSNQYRWGEYDGPINLIFTHVDSRKYLQEKTPKALDDALLAEMHELSGKSAGPSLIILHLMGSHVGYDSRYPADWGPFTGVFDEANRHLAPEYAKILNEYDNSIAFTDCLLAGVIAELGKQDRPTFLLYVSDHGEVIEDGRTVRRSGKSRVPDAYEIPFIVWMSHEYRKTFPVFVREAKKNLHKPLQTDKAFWGIAALAQLTWNDFPEEKNFFSSRYQPQERSISDIRYEKRNIQSRSQ